MSRRDAANRDRPVFTGRTIQYILALAARYPDVMAVESLHDADAAEHCRSAALDNQHQCLDRGRHSGAS